MSGQRAAQSGIFGLSSPDLYDIMNLQPIPAAFPIEHRPSSLRHNSLITNRVLNCSPGVLHSALPLFTSRTILAIILLLALPISAVPASQSDDDDGQGNRWRPANMPHTPSVFSFTRKKDKSELKTADTDTDTDSNTDSDTDTDTNNTDTDTDTNETSAKANPSDTAAPGQDDDQSDKTEELSDDLSVAPWVKSTRFTPEADETSGQGLSNRQFDEMLRQSPIDKGFGSKKVPDIWNRVRRGFRLSGYEHPRVDSSLKWYLRNSKYLDRVTERAKPFLHYILEEVEKRNMPTEFALLPVVESAFQPFAYSHGRAAGLWQFIPETGKRYGLKMSWWYDGRRDVYASTQSALNFLADLHERFDGDWLLALAAYNSGPGTVSRAIRKNQQKGRTIDFWSLDLPEETRGYVPKLLAVATLVADPLAYKLEMTPIPNRSYFERIAIGSQIDLARAAEMASMTIEQLYTLNPAFNRWATDPDGPHYLMIPLKNADRFINQLSELGAGDRIQWKRHKIDEGESLGIIAEKYQTTVDLLKEINNIKGKQIRAGKSLIIPVATKNLDDYRLTADSRLKKLQGKTRDGKKIIYMVKRGDSFWDIAKDYQLTAEQIAKWNGMAPGDPLFVGKKLVLWIEDKNRTENNIASLGTSAFPSPSSRQTTRKISYRVREGDSLSAISQKFKVSVPELRQWNDIEEGKYIHPGQNLKLFIDVTKQSENI